MNDITVKTIKILGAPQDNPPSGHVYQWTTVVDGSVIVNTKQSNGTTGAVSIGASGASYTPSSGAQTVAIDCEFNKMHVVTGHASGTAITFTVANVTINQSFIISITQGAVVSTITAWFATIRWAGGTPPTLTATATKRDTFGFICTGSATYDGFVIGQNA